MKKIFYLLLILSTVVLTSCQSENASSDSKSKSRDVVVDESAIDVEKLKVTEIKNIKEQLNSGDYSLSKSELDELKTEGLLTEEQYQELTQITKN